MTREVELVDGSGIFHDDEEDLKHEMIDTSKAKQIVRALKFVKARIRQGDSEGDIPADDETKDAISIVEGGKLSVNLATIQASFN